MSYDEFVARTSWRPGEILAKWSARRILKVAMTNTGLKPTGLQMLEVGVGRGWLAHAAHGVGITNFIGVEPTATLASIWRPTVPDIEVLEVSLPLLPSRLNGSMDLVIASNVIEHASNGIEAREWISSILDTVKNGGFIVVVCPDIRDFKQYFWDIDWSHSFPTSTSNLVQIFEDLNCEVTMAKQFRLGSVNSLITSVGFFLNTVIPTRILDFLGMLLVNKSLGRGIKAALIWSYSYVIVKKPLSEAHDVRS